MTLETNRSIHQLYHTNLMAWEQNMMTAKKKVLKFKKLKEAINYK